MKTPVIVLHSLVSGKSEERIIHKGISYSVRAYQLLVVGSSVIHGGSEIIQAKQA